MKKLLLGAAVIASMAGVSSCSDEHTYMLEGEGSVRLTTILNNDVKVAARGSLDELGDSAIVWISNSKGAVIRKYNGVGEIPAQIKLTSGNYLAEIWAGDSVPASFDKKYYKGRAPFTVATGETQVELVGKIANTVVSVEYSDSVDVALKDYTMTVEHRRGSLTFEGRDTRKGYFMMPSNSNALVWTLKGTQEDGSTFTKTDSIVSPQPTTEYVLKVIYRGSEGDESVGAGYLDIVIDQTEVPVEDEIIIKSAPKIMGYGYDINNSVSGQPFAMGKKSVYVSAVAALKSVVLESTMQPFVDAIGGEDIDLLLASPAVIASAAANGLTFTYNHGADQEDSNIKINFEASMLNQLDAGEYSVNISVTDVNDKVSTATLNLLVTAAKVAPTTDDLSNAATTWATSAVLEGTVLDDAATNLGFDYRALGETDWQHVDAVVSRAAGDKFTATITGLKPGTTYEYRPTCDDSVGGIAKFKTEAAAQIPNGGFEDWNTSSTPYLMYSGSESNMFWDSGNHGSSKMRKNVTVPDGDVKHSGNYSAKLASQFVGVGTIGRFAAGNAFVGKYLKTDGTDGVLGFGRPFESRPAKLTGYIKYKPKAIDNVESNAPSYIKKGDMDRGVVYLALLDGSIMDKEYSEFPVVIKTKTTQLFDYESRTDVVGYVKVLFDETEGDSMVPFTAEIEYFKTDSKVKYLLLTCAASYGGDYFSGGDGSTMWIDDLEFVYE